MNVHAVGRGHNGGPPLEDAIAPIHIGEKFLFLFEPYRHKALFGGRGSAKSHTIATVLVLLARMRKRERTVCRHPLQSDALLIVCARQFQNSIRDSVKELIEQKIKAHGFAHEFDVTEREIRHKLTGSRFIFIGLDRNPDSAKSLEGADICWVEEARTINSRSFEILIPTVRKPGSELWWSWNPEYREDPVDAYFRGGEITPPGAKIQQVGIEDNPYFYLTELPNEMWFMQRFNQPRYQHIWLGGYDDTFDSKVFSNVEIGRIAVPEYCAPRYGMDFGFGTDPSFMVKLYIIESQRVVYIAREFKGRVPLRQLPTVMREILESEGDPICADSAQPMAIEHLENEGFNIYGAVKGPGSIKAGINWLQGYRIIIDPDCEAMREEARLYSWQIDKKTKKVLNVPVDAHNHGWDAVRYACEGDMRDGVADDSTGGVMRIRL